MKKNLLKVCSLISVLLCLIFAFSGCFSNDGYLYDGYESANSSSEEIVVLNENSNGNLRKKLVTEELEIDANLSDIKPMVESISEKTKGVGGTVLSENHSINYDSNDYEYSTMKLKIPSDKVESFLQDIKGEYEITYEYTSTVDVTSSYNDNVDELEKVENEIAVYTRFYNPETNESEPGSTITVADKLTIMEKLESLETKKKELEKAIEPYKGSESFTKITISISEKDYTPVVLLCILGVFIVGIIIAVVIVIVHTSKRRLEKSNKSKPKTNINN